MVHNYLIHGGFVETLTEFEKEASFDSLNKEKINQERLLADKMTKDNINMKKKLGWERFNTEHNPDPMQLEVIQEASELGT